MEVQEDDLPSPYPRRGIEQNLARQAELHPDHTAIVFYGAEISYGALWREVRRLAGFLKTELHVAPGDRVALDLQNSPQYVIAYYAVLAAGGVVVPLNPMYRAQEVAGILADAAVAVAIVSADLLQLFSGWEESERLCIIVAYYPDYLPPKPVVPTGSLFDKPAPDLGGDLRLIGWSRALAGSDQPDLRSDPDAVCVLPYTSGSTGMPKGCPHTHASVMHTAAAQAEWYQLGPDSVVTAVQPLFHVAGMQGSMNAGIYAGATLLLMTRWDATAATRLFARYGVTFWNAPPTMIVDMLSQPSFDAAAFAAMKIITGGGAAMPVAIADRMRERFGLTYVEGYGMTETMSPTHLNPLSTARAGSIGIPIQQTISFVVDPEDLRILDDGEVGEIVVAGPQVIRNYWNNPEADLQSFARVEGRRMLRTGDLGYRDADGYFHIVDRLKRMINASGFKVWPAEVEGRLFEHPAVQQCCVIAAPDDYRGETVKAVVILKPECRGRVSEADIQAWARERLAAYKVPQVVRFVDSLPLTASYKVDWRALAALEGRSTQS